MKVLLLAVFCTLTASSSAWTLNEAATHVVAELRPALESMVMQWEYFVLFDEASCRFVQTLTNYWEPTLVVVKSNEAYRGLRDELTAAGIDWDTFMVDEMEPANGYFARFKPPHSCPTETNPIFIDMMRENVKSAFEGRKTYILDVVAEARAQSADYARIYDRISANTQAGIDIKCSPEMQRVDSHMASIEFELSFFLDIFGLVFGLQVPASC